MFYRLEHLMKRTGFRSLIAGLTIGLAGCASQDQVATSATVYSFSNHDLTIDFNQQLQSRLVSNMADQSMVLGDFRPTEYIELESGDLVTDFRSLNDNPKETAIQGELGTGIQTELVGLSADGSIQKTVLISRYDDFPLMTFFKVQYTNLSDDSIRVRKWVNNDYSLAINESPAESENFHGADFWSYEGASYVDRRDWVKPLAPGYNQENYMGMNASDYGSGTAIVDVWRQDLGVAIGHSETSPKLVAIPLRYDNPEVGAEFQIELEMTVALEAGESMETIETFVTLHEGDYYATLKSYRNAMAAKGLAIDEIPDSAYESIWCAWGYERDFNVDEVLATLPKAKELGIEWAVLDDGWQTAEGDWYLHPDKFPNGDADMQAFVQEIHDHGLKAKLWWAPLAVDPGTDLLHEHTDMLLLGEWGEVQDVTWWNSFYLCPAYEDTREYTRDLVRKMIGEWGFDGLKIDGQHLNGVPPCYNDEHDHESPQDSVEDLAEFWQLVYETAMEINPEAVVEICPCGTSYAFHNLPFMNQTVSSDPLSSWQVRHKGKTLKGLMGESAPYYGDHVELSDNASDFASSFGIGAVLGTKFTVNAETGPATQFLLDEEKEKTWAKWFGLYNEKMLPKGAYLGELYDIGFDLPETHAIEKNGHLYYGFYADEWDGNVELRGLGGGQYRVHDYINGVDLGVVEGDSATLDVKFTQYLLVELVPVP